MLDPYLTYTIERYEREAREQEGLANTHEADAKNCRWEAEKARKMAEWLRRTQ